MTRYHGPQPGFLKEHVRQVSAGSKRRTRLGIAVEKYRKMSGVEIENRSLDSMYEITAKSIKYQMTANLKNQVANFYQRRFSKQSGIDTRNPAFEALLKKMEKESDPTKLEADFIRIFKISNPEQLAELRKNLRALKQMLAEQKTIVGFFKGKGAIKIRNGKIYATKRQYSVLEQFLRKIAGREVFHL